jgi:predicted CXXCH cytochrome family protein
MRFGLISLGLSLCCALAVPSLVAAAEGQGCVTSDCHALLGKAPVVHQPVAEGDCASCHQATGQAHPGAGSMTLTEAEPGLCLQCHDNPAAGLAYPHSALAEGCSGCHSPHQGGLPQLVLQPGGKLCLICHADVKQGRFIHGPVKADNCRMCHAVHGGENEAMLNLPGKENCLACHVGIRQIMEQAKSQHDPVANGVCWDCHTPHSADYRPFIQEGYTEDKYVAYANSDYALCFKCHNEEAFTYALTSEATQFRNHNQNLHVFHVNRLEKGRTCRNCHGVHGAVQDHLLMSPVPDFGQWDIPLTWVSKGERATCYVGCHRPKTYDRDVFIRNR